MKRIVKNPDFIVRQIGEETLLIPIARARADLNAVLVLEGIGGVIWELLEQKPTEQQLLEILQEQYEADAQTIAKDTSHFLQELHALGAIFFQEE